MVVLDPRPSDDDVDGDLSQHRRAMATVALAQSICQQLKRTSRSAPVFLLLFKSHPARVAPYSVAATSVSRPVTRPFTIVETEGAA